MKKEVFNKVLYNKLSLLPEQEKSRIIEFYNEYIEDRIENGEYEENIIGSLGSIDSIVERIIQDYTKEKVVTPKFEENMKEDERINFDDVADALADEQPNPYSKNVNFKSYVGNPNMRYKEEMKRKAEEARITETEKSNKSKAETTIKKDKKSGLSPIKIILIIFGCIFLLPIIIGLLVGLGGLAIGIFAAGISLYIACFAMIFASLVSFFASFAILGINANSAFLQMATSVVIFGLGIIALYFCAWLTRICLRGIKKLMKVLVMRRA